MFQPAMMLLKSSSKNVHEAQVLFPPLQEGSFSSVSWGRVIFVVELADLWYCVLVVWQRLCGARRLRGYVSAAVVYSWVKSVAVRVPKLLGRF
jgi:hypothetical protein